jgi:hypothetical protein
MKNERSAFRLWSEFQRLIVAHLRAVDHQEFATAWSSSTQRTDWYAQRLLPVVAEAMGLRFLPELLLVDYALCTTTPGGSVVPLIFVESENDPNSAVDEVRKLCALAAPVRVLISVARWDTTSGVWQDGVQSLDRLREWRLACDDYASVYGPLLGIVAAMIGEWRDDNTFSLHCHSLAGAAWPTEYNAVALHQQMTVRQPLNASVPRARLWEPRP